MRISILFCTILFLCSCGKDTSSKKAQAELISGNRWIFEWGDMEDSLMARPVSQREINFFKNFKSRAENVIFDFKSDGIMEIQTSPTEMQGGKWYFDAKNNQLKMEIYQTSVNNPLDILELSSNRIVLAPDPKAPQSLHRIFVPYKEVPEASEE